MTAKNVPLVAYAMLPQMPRKVNTLPITNPMVTPSISSAAVTSLEKRLITRPRGVVSKKAIDVPKTFRSIISCMFLDANSCFAFKFNAVAHREKMGGKVAKGNGECCQNGKVRRWEGTIRE